VDFSLGGSILKREKVDRQTDFCATSLPLRPQHCDRREQQLPLVDFPESKINLYRKEDTHAGIEVKRV
jgi:hypothetical protein